MKKNIIFYLFTFFAVAIMCEATLGQNQQSKQHYFQLKTYHFDNAEQQKQTDEYLEGAYLPALHRAGINQVGVFKPHPSDSTSSPMTYVLIPFTSLDHFATLEDNLQADSQYLSDGRSFLEAPHDQTRFSRIQSVLLEAFEDAPTLLDSNPDGPKEKRVYELRSYESASEALNVNKVEMFNAGGEVAIFDRLNFNALFYGNVISGDKMPNLMYMTSFSDMESRDKHWEAFGQDAAWKKLAAVEKYQNNVSHIDIYFLQATSYSDI